MAEYDKWLTNVYPCLHGRREGTVLSFSASVCQLPQSCCLNSIISKSKQVTSHKLVEI